MQGAGANLLSLPVELVEMIISHVEYAYEINSLAQTCRGLYSIANYRLYRSYVNECSPRGLERIVKNDNADALRKLLDNGHDFYHYYRATQNATPILLTVDADLARIAEMLVAHTKSFLATHATDERKCNLLHVPHRGAYESHIRDLLGPAARKGSLGVIKVLVSSMLVERTDMQKVMSHAIKEGHLALSRYLLEEGVVHVDQVTLGSGDVCTYLAQAAADGNLEMVKLLVEAGANLNNPLFQRVVQSPVHIAAAGNHREVVQYLTENGMRSYSVKHSDIRDLVYYCRAPCSRLSSFGYDYYQIPNFRISNVVRGDDLKTIIPDSELQGCEGYTRRHKFYRMFAACDSLPLFEQLWNTRGSCDDWVHLKMSFQIAACHGNLVIAQYALERMIESNDRRWRHEWGDIIYKEVVKDCEDVLGFELLLKHGPSGNLPASRKDLENVLWMVPGRREHIEVLLRRGYLDNLQDTWMLGRLLHSGFAFGNLALVSRLIEDGGLGLIDALDVPYEYHTQTVLQYAAFYSSLEIFRKFLTTGNLTLDPNNRIHRAALVSAAVQMKMDVVGYFLDNGFKVNALYGTPTTREDSVTGTLIIRVATTQRYFSGLGTEHDRKETTAAVEFLLDHGAHIGTKNCQGRTALSIAVENDNRELVSLLFNRGADPLVSLDLHRDLSPLEQIIRLFLRDEYDVSYLDWLQASLETMSARGYQGEDFLHPMPSFEGTLSRPKVKSRFGDSFRVMGPMRLENGEDKLYVRWSHFFLIRELRKAYWRAMHPVSSE